MDFIIVILVGIVIGWNLPQPLLVQWLQQKIIDLIKGFMERRE